jgi:hypothetical protein
LFEFDPLLPEPLLELPPLPPLPLEPPLLELLLPELLPEPELLPLGTRFLASRESVR